MNTPKLTKTIEIYKMRTVVLSYHHVAEGMLQFPVLDQIHALIYRHFVQEFSTTVRTYERYMTYGATDEMQFLHKLEEGKYDKYAPSLEDVINVLNVLEFAYYDPAGNLYNAPIQEVW